MVLPSDDHFNPDGAIGKRETVRASPTPGEITWICGTAPDRYWVHAAEAREKAPKPNSREFEAWT